MESLARVVCSSPHIEGIPYATKDKRIGMIADDTLLAFKATGQGAQEIDAILKAFHKHVGLHINYDKSVACTLGKTDHNYASLFSNPYKCLHRGQSFKYLGLNLGLNESGQVIGMDNFFGVVNKLDRTVALLRYAQTSVLGKILQLKTLIASQFLYWLTLLSSTSYITLQALNQYY